MFSNNNSPKGFVGTSFVVSDGIFLWIWSLMYHYSKLFPHRLLFIQSNRSQSNQTLLYSCSEKIQNNLSKLMKCTICLSVFTFQICLTLMFPDFCVEDQVIISFFNPFFLFCIAAPQVQPKIQIILHAVGGALLCLLPRLHRHLPHDVWLFLWILQTVSRHRWQIC